MSKNQPINKALRSRKLEESSSSLPLNDLHPSIDTIKAFRNPLLCELIYKQKQRLQKIKEQFQLNFPKQYLNSPGELFQLYKSSNIMQFKPYSNPQQKIMSKECRIFCNLHYSKRKQPMIRIESTFMKKTILKQLKIGIYRDAKILDIKLLQSISAFENKGEVNFDQGLIYFSKQIQRFTNLRIFVLRIDNSDFKYTEKSIVFLLFTISKLKQLEKITLKLKNIILHQNIIPQLANTIMNLQKLSDFSLSQLYKSFQYTNFNSASVWAQIVSGCQNLEKLSLSGYLNDDQLEVIFNELGNAKRLNKIDFQLEPRFSPKRGFDFSQFQNLQQLDHLVIRFNSYYEESEENQTKNLFPAISKLLKISYLDFSIQQYGEEQNIHFPFISKLPLSLKILKINIQSLGCKKKLVGLNTQRIQQLVQKSNLQELYISFSNLIFAQASFVFLTPQNEIFQQLIFLSLKISYCKDEGEQRPCVLQLLRNINFLTSLKNIQIQFCSERQNIDQVLLAISSTFFELKELNILNLEIGDRCDIYSNQKDIDQQVYIESKTSSFKQLAKSIANLEKLQQLHIEFYNVVGKDIGQDILYSSLRSEIEKHISIC